jgi:hypothetical protein
MDWLEEELKSALSRKEPDEGFDERVLAAARRPRVVAMPRRWLAAAAAVIVIAGAGAGEAYRRHRGQEAKEQVMLAMRITGQKLHVVQARIAGEK